MKQRVEITTSARSVLPDPALPLPEAPLETVVSMFLSQAATHPNHAALCQGRRKWTYGELESRSLSIASALMAKGLRKGEPIAVSGDRSFGFIAALLAVLRAGGVMLPIEPMLPGFRRRSMIESACAGSLLWAGDAGCEEYLEYVRSGLSTYRVDPEHGKLLDRGCPGCQAHLPDTSIDDPACVFFTSGTTGAPKGVLASHKGISHFVRWQSRTFAVGAGDRVAQLTSPSFDVYLRDLFLPLSCGAVLCLPEEADLLDVPAWLARDEVTVLHAVPSLGEAWVRSAKAGVELSALRWVFFAGEPLTNTLVKRWRDKFQGNCRLVNLYGPTETTLAKCCYIVPNDPTPGVQPIGSPLPQSQALVMDGDHLCRLGEPGEIVIRTPYRTLGYINPNSRSIFVPNPFNSDPQDLLYYTGDQGLYGSDGLLRIMGRLDDQVKIHGVRVEPEEVRAVLLQCQGVDSCVIIAHTDEDATVRLAAYVVPSHPNMLEKETLRGYLEERLPPVMIPSFFELLDALPLSTNGKVDRSLLPAPSLTDPESSRARIAPRTPVERALALIWRDLLKVVDPSIHDNFFASGGDSLLVVRLVSRIRSQLRVHLPLKAVFKAPTIERLAAFIEPMGPVIEDVLKVPLQPFTFESGKSLIAVVDRNTRARTTRDFMVKTGCTPGSQGEVEREYAFPASYAQRRMWFLDRLEQGGAHYNIPMVHRVTGRLDVAALEEALRAIVERHEMLSTRFDEEDGEPVQVISRASFPVLSIVDLTGLGEMEQTQRAGEIILKGTEEPFDLSRAPLLRSKLLKLAEEDHVLFVTMHHIVSDAWSMGVFRCELSELYRARHRLEPASLPELPVQYADYTVWQRERLKGAVLEAELDYWRRQLQGMEPLDLPLDRQRSSAMGYRGSRFPVELSASLAARLKSMADGFGATLFMTLLSLFQILLSRLSGQEDIAVGTPIAGRNQVEIENLIGLFVNTLVLRADLSDDPSFRLALLRTRNSCLDAYLHQELPFERLVEELQPVRDQSRHPLFQVMFAYQNAADPALELEGVSVGPFPVESKSAKFELLLALQAEADGIKGFFEFNTDLFEEATIARMAQSFSVLAQSAADDPEKPVSRLSCLTAQARNQILFEWNDTAAEYPKDKCFHELFQDQVNRSPEAVAVVCAGKSLTYRELNSRANRVAARLLSCGLQPDDTVGIYVERSVEMMVGLLSILKAGGAITPLDPNYPKDRIEYMLEDSGSRILITQGRLRDNIGRFSGATVCIDSEWEEISREEDKNPTTPVLPENLVYVIYTSGSTGKPKGVQINHRALVNVLSSVGKETGFSSRDTILSVATVSFDIFYLEAFLPLMIGGRVVVAERDDTLDGLRLAKLISEHGVNVMQATPSTWDILLESGWTGHDALKIISGGEPLAAGLARPLLKRCKELWNLYGPTETTIYSTACRVQSADEPILIGSPIANTQTYILDRWLQPVPVGVVGELYIGGDGLSRGYLNRPELTAERFIPHPFRKDARIYKTGDLARHRPDGSIECLGRIDLQVKLRGFRIELGEIEARIKEMESVAAGVVVLREDKPGDKRLVAYCVPKKGCAIPVSELRTHLHSKLPGYMVPSAFVEIAALPLTPSGKVDRKALPAPKGKSIREECAFEPPKTPAEEVLSNIWCEVLGIDRVGVNDNFFELGGHSLLATRVMSRVRSAFRVEMPLRILFDNPTISGMAGALGALSERSFPAQPDAIQPAPSGCASTTSGSGDHSRIAPLARISRSHTWRSAK